MISDEEMHLKRCAEILSIAECRNETISTQLLALDAALTSLNGDWKSETETELLYGAVSWREDVLVVEDDEKDDEEAELAILLHLYCGNKRSIKLCISPEATLAPQIYINTVLKVTQVRGKSAYHKEIEVL